ncbi:hypothetical protein JXM83_07245 [Candidatus Woesearchaeota archaeon]|nr:hypothetical protein [Candidatus Woesearchaeota archaeon]
MVGKSEEAKKVNIAISLKTHTRAKLISVLKNTTLNDFLAKAIEDAVEKDKELIKNLLEDDDDE